MSQPFAIITFRDTGPIKTWSDMRGAQIHNARTKPIEHAVPGAPAPEHLIGTGDLVADAKARLRGAKLDPDRLRKNGVIAYEAVMTASPAFFSAGTIEEQDRRLREWRRAQVDFAVGRWGSHRVASMVLHLDEKTPHIHIVIVPLDVKSDRRRTDRSVRWGLNGRTISGPGQFDRLQDDYAAAMAGFGLVRGVAGSGRKHEPMARFMERTAKAREAAEVAEREVRSRQSALMLREQMLLEQAAEVEKEKAEAAQERARLRRAAADMEAERARLAEASHALSVEQDDLLQARAAIDAERRRIDQVRADVDARAAGLADAVRAADRFMQAMRHVPPHATTRQPAALRRQLHSCIMPLQASPPAFLGRVLDWRDNHRAKPRKGTVPHPLGRRIWHPCQSFHWCRPAWPAGRRHMRWLSGPGAQQCPSPITKPSIGKL